MIVQHPGTHPELAVALKDGRNVDEPNIGEAGADELPGQAFPVESVVSGEVGLVGVEGAFGILVKVRDGQPATFDTPRRRTHRADLSSRRLGQRAAGH